MKHYLGLSAGYHDAAAAVVREDGDILFAAHSERYSGVKNDPNLDPELLEQCLSWDYHTVAWYERPWMHNLQQWVSGQKQYGAWSTQRTVARHLGQFDRTIKGKRTCYPHHLSHAAAGFQTSPFESAAVVVIDAIGELDTISIYHATYDRRGRAQYRRVWNRRYPHSIGLFYSAITEVVGLKPMEEEYITMGMAAYGNRAYTDDMCAEFLLNVRDIKFRHNCHAGIDPEYMGNRSPQDIAASAQVVTEHLIMNVIRRARMLTGSDNLVYSGGVALNCLANRNLGRCFSQIWIMPCPGDAGSGLGAAALAHGGRLRWRDAFLGQEISGPYPVKAVLDELISRKIVGVASGRAEWGPRALGNRSLLADPRGLDIKDRVNEIKRRQKFRPFAPVILEEMVDEYFDMPPGWNHCRYMQSVARCRWPDRYPAICHVDGTSRVQTVPADGSGIRQLLEQWYLLTGCPMLLNTSLNIRGEPMVNDRSDANRFEREYGVPVCS